MKLLMIAASLIFISCASTSRSISQQGEKCQDHQTQGADQRTPQGIEYMLNNK